MKKILNIFLILIMFLPLSTNVFAQSNSENMYKLKNSYIINKDGTISKDDKSIDKYSMSLNFLIDTNSITIDSNGKIVVYFDGDINSFNLKKNKEINYNALYQEIIDPQGKYYGIVPEEEINNIINNLDKDIPKEEINNITNNLDKNILGEEFYIINSPILIFDYYKTVLSNTVILAYKFYSYENMGFTPGAAATLTGSDFADKVRNGVDWDYKLTLGVNTLYMCDMKDYIGFYDGEAIGNMHYGTVGTYLFSPFVLKAAAGFYQVVSHTWNPLWFTSYFDDPLDQYYIQLGIDLHSQYNFIKAPYILNWI